MKKTQCVTLAIAAGVACASAQQVAAQQGQPAAQKASAAAKQAAQPQPSAAKQTSASAAKNPTTFQLGSIATCRPSAQASVALNRLVSFADPNADGIVTRAEASSATNFLVGGFFFRADQNGDGVVTSQEGLQARKDFLNEQPALANLLQSAREAGDKSPVAKLAQMLDIQYGQSVKAEEARTAAKNAVADLFASVDKNNDGKLTGSEARDASTEGARALGRAMFRSVDTNNDSQVSSSEFYKSLEQPAEIAFKMADKNSDGHLSQSEAIEAVSQVTAQLEGSGPVAQR